MIIVLFTCFTQAFAQGSKHQPEWWFGGALGVNFNFYSGTLQQLNPATVAPQAFSKGAGTGLFLSPLLEYRPGPTWGGMLSLGFDGRSGSFDDVGGSSLSTSMNYLSLEPSVRFSPFPFGLYFFAGPRLGFNVAKSFSYTPPGAGKTDAEWSGVRGTVFGGQLGAGYEFPLSSPESEWQINLSPFIAAHFGQGPRSAESWSLASVRTGIAIVFGSTKEARSRVEGALQFSVRAPKIIPIERKVKETFPMRNYIFFDEGSNAIPTRYILLSREQAATFKEEQLLQPEPKDLTGRSRRQLTVYHNILNILGDRMRRFPQAMITLLGAAEQGPPAGEALAKAVKQYLIDVFGIEERRIKTEGHSKPPIASSQPGGTRELELVGPEDRRVDVGSASLELLEPVQIISLQEDPLDSDILLTVSNAQNDLSSWSVVFSDENGGEKRYGPFTSDQERVSGRSVLGEKIKGSYTVVVEGETRSGQLIRKEQSVHLIRSDEPEEAPGFRFSILFEFDQSKTVATYERFLTGTVAPLIADGNSVIIHGHTDIVGEESHNLKLSRDRAQETMNIIEKALVSSGKRRVKFDTYGFGEDVRRAPFDNTLPEERFYNRTVIIDIVPE
ncbi:MAG: outer membrane beta-barrel protein [Ignavibacteria bacterium]|nr:outer membrane beta-barrel protein [Ignavibacteria bacterium]MBI3765938.1 outer membrane beta-barrel protein [Ignavibacteriales bacterium]